VPTVPFEVPPDVVAIPLESVVACWLLKPFVGPIEGTLKVTVTPGTGRFDLSTTNACSCAKLLQQSGFSRCACGVVGATTMILEAAEARRGDVTAGAAKPIESVSTTTAMIA
jgi:hypothetical protein